MSYHNYDEALPRMAADCSCHNTGANRGLCNISRTSDLTTGINSLPPRVPQMGVLKFFFWCVNYGAPREVPLKINLYKILSTSPRLVLNCSIKVSGYEY